MLNNAVAELSKTYGTVFQFRFLGLADAIAVAAFSGLIGGVYVCEQILTSYRPFTRDI